MHKKWLTYWKCMTEVFYIFILIHVSKEKLWIWTTWRSFDSTSSRKTNPLPSFSSPPPRISTIVQPQSLTFFWKIPAYIPSQNVITEKMNICTFHLKRKVSVLEGDIEIYKTKRKKICKCKLHWVFFVKMPKHFEPIFAIFSVTRFFEKILHIVNS